MHDPHTTALEVDLGEARRRLRLAREQMAAHATTEHVRSAGARRHWPSHGAAEQAGR
ncbi:MAG TPA: hypothetical protein VK501_10245 [Baekduia sp.]|uniref:hypothetical protein n=1 Tax=Baekduia sp. TaxID=2600305 RepID=UPI002C3A70FD|nr:hypothetical protein [Baekduia sp.]HMJ34289.1 hypothetical protein [Baekduia sp.]